MKNKIHLIRHDIVRGWPSKVTHVSGVMEIVIEYRLDVGPCTSPDNSNLQDPPVFIAPGFFF